MAGTATYIGQRNSKGDGRVYRCDPPMETEDGTTEHVWVSAVYVTYSGPETYIFASDEKGNVTNWGELPGSYRGGMDHETALTGAGYEMKEQEK